LSLEAEVAVVRIVRLVITQVLAQVLADFVVQSEQQVVAVL
jgi:hypothetical protein